MQNRAKRSQSHFYNHSLALLTDLYQLTMCYGYWKAGLENRESVFHLFFRKRPFHGGFTVAAGLDTVIEYLENFHFDASDLTYLASLCGADNLPLFEPAFFDFLAQMQFTCHLDAIAEGNVVFPYEPLVRIQGPLIQCQLLESSLLNLINFPTLIATKAARMCIAAGGDPVLEFGLRRAQGIDGALTASRAAYIGGCDSTSNVLAGKLFGIPVRGTHAHSWIMVFDDELEAFQKYAEYLPNNCVFLVDTYDSLEGVKKAIIVGNWLKKQGKKFLGIRLDSGDLTYLSIKSREMLDAAGFYDAVIIASNDLDETIISELKREGAQINVWGVGTNLVTSSSQPALDGVYKLSAIRDPGGTWKYKLKLSEQMVKVSNPGILQVKRFMDQGSYIADAVYDVNLGLNCNSIIIDPLDSTRQKILNSNWESRDLLVPIFRSGKLVYNPPSLHTIRSTTQKELALFHSSIKRFINPHAYPVGMEKTLYELKVNLIKNIRNQVSYATDISN
ncbi:MAG: nicotinate phosphoribosyltransferase [Parachlamydiaceae bacterium]|nr:nicotinate phosphoribosyltransferase [Parachlamydiaceae bacterium]